MENKLNEILSLMKRIDEQFSPGEKESDFVSVQRYGKEKYGDFDKSPSLDIFDTGNFNMFKKLKQFMDDIIGVKISLTNIPDVKDSDENLFIKNIQNILATKRRCGLLGNVFEGLLYKYPDDDPGPDLKRTKIELKTTGPNSNAITLFTRGSEAIADISPNISDLLKGQISIAEPSVEMYFGKTFFRNTETADNEIEFDNFEKKDYIEREIGILKDKQSGDVLAYFYLRVEAKDNRLDYSLRVVGANMPSLDEIFCSFSVPYNNIDGPLNEKVKNVFHVRGKIVDEYIGEKKETYAIFLGYEAMTLKEGLSTRSLIENAILKPIINASLKSEDVIKRKEDEKNRKLKAADTENGIDFSDGELNERYDYNRAGELIYRGKHEIQIANPELKTVFKVRGVSFKLQLSHLSSMYDIEKK